MAQQVNLLACSPHCPFSAECQAGKREYQFYCHWFDPTRTESNPSLQLQRRTLLLHYMLSHTICYMLIAFQALCEFNKKNIDSQMEHWVKRWLKVSKNRLQGRVRDSKA